MLAQSFVIAELQLQLHRRWFCSFINRTKSHEDRASPASTRSLVKHYGFLRPRYQQFHLQSRFRSASYASNGFRRVQLKAQEQTRQLPDADLLALRQAVQEVRIADVVELYQDVRDKRLLRPGDVNAIAQCLHQCCRVERREAKFENRRTKLDVLVAFAETMVKDIKAGQIPPHRRAIIHLLGLFKESEVRDAGIKFWNWLEEQDDDFLSADVYGAAIELLAVNGSPLSEMEVLYQQALSRFPGTFAAYHVSPEAILSDRSQATTLKGIPVSLLQGILTARLLHGDTRNAYLALDTALRLYPDQTPTRFFMLFLEERPLFESYAVFAIACRAGIVIPRNQFRHLLAALRTSSDVSSTTRHALAVRSMLSAIYLYAGAGGKMSQNVINELIIAMTQFLRLPGIAALEAKKKQQLVNEVMDLIRTSLSIFARHSVAPGISAFNAIITNLGGYGHSKQLIGIALSDAQALNLEVSEITRRSILTAAGMLGDRDFFVKAWRQIVQGRAEAGQIPDATDFHCFAKAAHASGHIAFAKEEFEAFKEQMPVQDQYGIEGGLQDSNRYDLSIDTTQILDVSLLYRQLEKVRSDLQVIDERTKERPAMLYFGKQQLPMTLVPTPSKIVLPEAEMSKIYDELTTEQRPSSQVDMADGEEDTALPEPSESITNHELAPDPTLRPAVTSTNMPFGVLRYENWKSINWLLEQAEINDAAYHKLVDEAIAAGKVPPQRSLRLDLDGIDKTASFGLCDTIGVEKTKREKPVSEEEYKQVRERILRLRGRQM